MEGRTLATGYVCWCAAWLLRYSGHSGCLGGIPGFAMFWVFWKWAFWGSGLFGRIRELGCADPNQLEDRTKSLQPNTKQTHK
jgi:hypothetical protein